MPSDLVRKSASPGRAPAFGQMASGWTVPTTARPYFGSVSRIVCPPARIAPAARTRSSAPARTSPSTSTGSSSGNAAMESASSGTPPIANTSFSAFVAAIAPNVRGSSTRGGKKSTVNTSARSSSRRYTAASSAGSSPTSRSSASAGTSPESSVSRRAAEYFAAQPPARAREVSGTVSTRKSLGREESATERRNRQRRKDPFLLSP